MEVSTSFLLITNDWKSGGRCFLNVLFDFKERELNLEGEAKRTYPFKPTSITRTFSIIPHVMAKAKKPLSKKCRPGINY
jgi:hypothetical protein